MQIKARVANSDNLNLTPITISERREFTLAGCPLTSAPVHTYTKSKNCNKNFHSKCSINSTMYTPPKGPYVYKVG